MSVRKVFGAATLSALMLVGCASESEVHKWKHKAYSKEYWHVKYLQSIHKRSCVDEKCTPRTHGQLCWFIKVGLINLKYFFKEGERDKAVINYYKDRVQKLREYRDEHCR